MTRISEKMTAASKLKRRIGCSVISAAYSGVKQRSRKPPALARSSRYSGKYRPACRIIQIGGTFWRRPASTSMNGLTAEVWGKWRSGVFGERICAPNTRRWRRGRGIDGLIGRGIGRGCALFRRRRWCAVGRGLRLEHHADAFCLAPEHAAKPVKMLGRNHQLEFPGNSELAFDLQRCAGRRDVANDTIDPCAVERDRAALQHALARAGSLILHHSFDPKALSVGVVARYGRRRGVRIAPTLGAVPEAHHRL